MPLPMIHLLMAHEIGEKLDKESNGYFILGSVAPDAIHKREKTNRKDKHKTHMFLNGRGNEEDVKENKRISFDILRSADKKDTDYFEFAKGYCIHTMLDMYWIKNIFNVLSRTLRAGAIGYNDVRSIYYRECNYCDAMLYNSLSFYSGYEKILKNITPMAFENLLTENEIDLWKYDVLMKMEKYKKYEGQKPHYITLNRIYKLIDEFTCQIITEFESEGYKL